MPLHDSTTLVCLFHTQDHAQAALNDLLQTGIPQSSISLIGGPGAAEDVLDKSELASLGMPDHDYDHLKEGVRRGGVVVGVTASSEQSDRIEDIFEKHSAKKIDEAGSTDRDLYAAAAPLPNSPQSVQGETAIPVVEEEMVVGKRQVDQGGVRVYRRVVETPVEESVTLRDEHVTVERKAVDRPVTDADLSFKDRTIELTETAEEAVVSKNAYVVEEVLVGKTSSERTETVRDTVRKTEVDVEEVPSGSNINSQRLSN